MSEMTAPVPAWRSGSRWLLLGSLALNLFFIGIAVAMAVRDPPSRQWSPDVFVRIERLASTLPPADAQILRAAVNANHDAIEKSHTAYRSAREDIRETLREEPFKAEDMRAAVARASAARQTYDQVMQGVFADAAANMTSAGRNAMADWPRRRKRKDKSR